MELELNSYLEGGVKKIVAKASRFYLLNRNGRRFITHFVPAAKAASQKRKQSEANGEHIPPFLIASIATRCNLHCAGCYARANHSVLPGGEKETERTANAPDTGDPGLGVGPDVGAGQSCAGAQPETEMTAAEWDNVFAQAEDMGISFILLAGGEPLLRMDVLRQAAAHTGLAFPVFTNGTLFDKERVDFFDENRNLIPVLSIEGTGADTDSRRGEGVAQKIYAAGKKLKAKGILFGASITVTSENHQTVTDPAFLAALAANGCTVVIFVEYVPAEAGSEALALSEAQNQAVARQVAALKERFTDMVLLSFPGDEKMMGGCLAAGRGFFHINAAGGAEPCPFSPYSDVSLKTSTLREALHSPLFTALHSTGILAKPHTGGCVLFEQEDTVRNLVKT